MNSTIAGKAMPKHTSGMWTASDSACIWRACEQVFLVDRPAEGAVDHALSFRSRPSASAGKSGTETTPPAC